MQSIVDNIFNKTMNQGSDSFVVENIAGAQNVNVKRKIDQNLSSSGHKLKKLKTLGISISNPIENNLNNITSSDSDVKTSKLPFGLDISRQTSSTPPPPKFQREDIVNLLKQDKASSPTDIENNPAAPNVNSNKIPKVDIKNLNVEHYNNMAKTKKQVDSLETLDKKSGKGVTVSKISIQSPSNNQIKENGTEAEPAKINSNSSSSENQCTQCGKSSAHIVAIIKQVNELENRLMTDLNQKEDAFKTEKESWKVRENELMEALATRDDSKEIEKIRAELKRTNEVLDLKKTEKQEQAMKIVEMQELNDELSDKYDRVQKELEHLKNLPKNKTEAGDSDKVENLDRKFLIDNINNLEDKVKQKEDFIAGQAKTIVALELDMCEKDDLINSLKSDLDLKEKDILMQEEGLLELQEKIEENEKEIQSKHKIIFDIQEKEVSILNIINEKEECENKYSKVQDLNDTLKQENKDLITENEDLKQWKDIEVEKLRSSLKLRLKNMIEKNLAKDNLYKQKISSLENLIKQKG